MPKVYGINNTGFPKERTSLGKKTPTTILFAANQQNKGGLSSYWFEVIKQRQAEIAHQKAVERARMVKAAQLRAASVLRPTAIVSQRTLPTVYATANIPAILARIKMCESGGSYTAQNPSSSASGAYQFIDGTWAGYGGYSRALYAPPAVQDAKALIVYKQSGTGPWVSSMGCWG